MYDIFLFILMCDQPSSSLVVTNLFWARDLTFRLDICTILYILAPNNLYQACNDIPQKAQKCHDVMSAFQIHNSKVLINPMSYLASQFINEYSNLRSMQVNCCGCTKTIQLVISVQQVVLPKLYLNQHPPKSAFTIIQCTLYAITAFVLWTNHFRPLL